MLIEHVVGGKYNRNNLIEVGNEFEIDAWGKQAGEEYYSVFNLHESVYDHLRVAGKLKGYKGPVAAPYLWWDIDEDELSQAYASTIELYNRLINVYGCSHSNIKVFFSGRKGFHIMYDSPAMESKGFDVALPRIVRTVCMEIASGINVDEKVYNKNRIFRVINSVHPDTGYYKVDVTDYIITPVAIDVIIARSSDQFKTVYTGSSRVEPNAIMKLLLKAEKEALENPNVSASGSINAQDLIEMFNNGVKDGSRNDSLTRIAGMLHQKHDYEMMYAMVAMVNNQSPTPLEDSEVVTICESVEQYDVSPPHREISITKVQTVKTAGQAWFDMFANNGYTNYGPLFPHLTKTLEMCIPGDVVLLVAASGVGKTAVGLQVGIADAQNNGGRCLMFSLEMSDMGVFFRIAIQESISLADETGYIQPKAVAQALHQDADLRNTINREYEKLLVVDDVSNLDEATLYVDMIKQELDNHGEELTSVILDYGQMLDGMHDIAKSAVIARSIKPFAKRHKIRFYVLLQTNKSFTTGRPTLNQIEGSGAWKQAADYALILYNHSTRKDILQAAFDKNRWGMPGDKFSFLKTGLKLSTIPLVEDDENPVEKGGEY